MKAQFLKARHSQAGFGLLQASVLVAVSAVAAVVLMRTLNSNSEQQAAFEYRNAISNIERSLRSQLADPAVIASSLDYNKTLSNCLMANSCAATDSNAVSPMWVVLPGGTSSLVGPKPSASSDVSGLKDGNTFGYYRKEGARLDYEDSSKANLKEYPIRVKAGFVIKCLNGVSPCSAANAGVGFGFALLAPSTGVPKGLTLPTSVASAADYQAAIGSDGTAGKTSLAVSKDITTLPATQVSAAALAGLVRTQKDAAALEGCPYGQVSVGFTSANGKITGLKCVAAGQVLASGQTCPDGQRLVRDLGGSNGAYTEPGRSGRSRKLPNGHLQLLAKGFLQNCAEDFKNKYEALKKKIKIGEDFEGHCEKGDRLGSEDESNACESYRNHKFIKRYEGNDDLDPKDMEHKHVIDVCGLKDDSNAATPVASFKCVASQAANCPDGKVLLGFNAYGPVCEDKPKPTQQDDVSNCRCAVGIRTQGYGVNAFPYVALWRNGMNVYGTVAGNGAVTLSNTRDSDRPECDPRNDPDQICGFLQVNCQARGNASARSSTVTKEVARLLCQDLTVSASGDSAYGGARSADRKAFGSNGYLSCSWRNPKTKNWEPITPAELKLPAFDAPQEFLDAQKSQKNVCYFPNPFGK